MFVDKLLLRIPEAADALSLGRSKTYDLIASGELPIVRIGRAIRIHAEALKAWAAAQASSNG